MYKSFSEQKDEALKDLPILQVLLEKAQKEASSIKWEHVILAEKVRLFEIIMRG